VPWTAADASKHKKGLTEKQARQWAAIANSSLSACLKEGKDQSFCEGRAIRMASGSVGKDLDSDNLALVVEAPIAKAEDEKRRLFGWASIAVMKDGTQIVDLQGDAIDIEDLAEAFYEYVRESGEMNVQHSGPVRGRMIEAMVFTPDKLEALGLAKDALPLGAWIGFHIEDPEDYRLIKEQGMVMFSIEGTGIREPF